MRFGFGVVIVVLVVIFVSEGYIVSALIPCDDGYGGCAWVGAVHDVPLAVVSLGAVGVHARWLRVFTLAHYHAGRSLGLWTIGGDVHLKAHSGVAHVV